MLTIDSFYVSLKDLSTELSEYLVGLFKFPFDDTKRQIENRFSLLQQDIGVYVEYPYVDKLYRNTFYNFFSSKHKSYDRDCVRISFFSRTFDSERLLSYQQVETEECLGYVCIRPFYPSIFGS